jgi:caffeoyl-CoA O-methyltransferase
LSCLCPFPLRTVHVFPENARKRRTGCLNNLDLDTTDLQKKDIRYIILKEVRKKMRKKTVFYRFFAFLFLLVMLFANLDFARQDKGDSNLDKKVKKFLGNHRGQWYDMNVPESDGKVLFDLIVKHKYKKALEIGTSTGHSAIWIAWALSKTGGKLVTIEINESRRKEALANFKEAGLSEYIDARLANAHQLVPQLEGPFDFVFSDADKGWYKNYFVAVLPKLEVGGCFTAHNVSMRSGYRMGGIKKFLDYVKSLPNVETTIVNSGYPGISVSFKKSEK